MIRFLPIPADDAAFMQRVNLGQQCPTCYYRGTNITRGTALGLPLFECPCGASWFDILTQPATHLPGEARP